MPKPYDAAIKAEAIQRVLAGETPYHIAKEMGISRNSVAYWQRQAGLTVNTVEQEKREELGELIGQLLLENIRALRSIAGLASDRSWTEKQNASDLAIFYGVLADKSVRILGALRPAEEDDSLRPVPPETYISD